MNRHGAHRPAHAAAALAGLVALALVATGCVPAVGDAGPLPSPAGSAGPSPAASSPTAAPSLAPPSPVVTQAPTGSPAAPAGSPAPGASATGTTLVEVYFLKIDRLVAVQRSLPKTVAVGRAAMQALLAGPTATESAGPDGLGTVIPRSTSLLDISVGGGIAVVDLSGEFESGGGSASMFARLAQVVYTLTQFPGVSGVTFRLDGQPVTTFSSEGIVLDRPSVRADYRDYLPAIFMDRPAWGASLTNPARLQGLANVFEAQFAAEITAADGTMLARRSITASCGTGCWGTFDVTIPYTVDRAQPGWVTVYDLSARDGTRENVSSYPVTLTPAG